MARAKKAAPVVVEQTNEEKLATLTKYTLDSLRQHIVEGKRVASKFVEKIANDANPAFALIYAARWAEASVYSAEFGYQCESVMVYVDRQVGRSESAALTIALGEQVRRCRDSLLDDSLRGSSTSAFANATEAAQRAARSRFYRDFSELAATLERLAPSIFDNAKVPA